MTKRIGWTLLCAVLLYGGAALAVAQDQTPPAQDQAPAAAPETTPAKPAKKHHGHMGACQDDVKTLCPDAKGPKAVHACLDKNEDKLSDACKAERAKMKKRWEKHHKKEMKDENAPSSQAPADQQPANPAPQNQ